MASMTPKSKATALVERMLSIPPEPEPPAGAPDSIRTFRAARGFYRYRRLQWAAKQLSAVVGITVGITILAAAPDFPGKLVVDVFELFGIAVLLVAVPLTYLMLHLDYQLRWYIVTDRSLRIREGLIRVGEKTMSFANIQNVSIRQGPLQRLFGIADVEVRTAGGGATQPGHAKSPEASMHLGYFRGVENAEEIRDAILVRVRRLRDSGLGDPDSEHATPAAPDLDLLSAARELLEEARALRLGAS